MKSLASIICLLLFVSASQAQISDKAFTEVYQRINGQRIFNLDRSDPLTYKRDSMEVVEIQQLLEFFHDYLNEEHRLNGKAGFEFAGNQNDLTDLLRFGVNGGIDKGAYPYEVDFNLQVQTTIQNGQFQENLSDIDISFDFHPIVPKVDTNGDGLWLENYVFIKRFNNNFLGIEQRYETGAGFVFNLFSKNKLTEKGQDNLRQLNNVPKYETYGTDLTRCLEDCYIKKSVLNITEEESEVIVNTRRKYKRSNTKKYSKLRLAMLIGLYYEIENSTATNNLFFNGRDTMITQDFQATNLLRWEFRPTLVWKPKDRYTLRVYPYFKMPLGDFYSEVRQGDLVDRRYDYFVDFQSSFTIEVERNFKISIDYRHIYDHAPKRAYLLQNDGSYRLLVGQKNNSNYGVSFRFGF